MSRPISPFAALPLLAVLWVSLACDPTPRQRGDDDNDDGPSTLHDAGVVDDDDACFGGAPSRGPSEPCCLAFGPDACGANLFCAAFDGRTVPTCYVERTRLDGEACGADVHCASGSCADAGVCRASPGQPCTREAGCAPFQGDAYVCVGDGSDDMCLRGSRATGGACDSDSGCDSGICVDDRCASGAEGAACDVDGDCIGGACVGGTCSAGAAGDTCATDGDCASGLVCAGGTCATPGLGDACGADADCASVLGGCFEGLCTAAAEGDACDSDPECGLNRCVDGACLAVCEDSFTCALRGIFTGTLEECREGTCVEVEDQGGACVVDEDCAMDLARLECASGTCRLVDGALCSEDVACASGACEPVVRDRCVDAQDRTRAPCADVADCSPGEQCLPRAVDECVAP